MGASIYTQPKNYLPVSLLAAILVAIAVVGLGIVVEDRPTAWLSILLLMTAFAVIVGHGITGRWRGILIDPRNKMSLSRLQILVWTLVILSALVTAILSNVAACWETQCSWSPLDIEIPSQLWTLMGISTAAAVASPAMMVSASGKQVDRTKIDIEKVAQNLEKDNVKIDRKSDSVIVRNMTMDDARWGDLLKGDEVGTVESVALGKLQMFFFTFILAVGYAAAIATLFNASGSITELPMVDEGMNVLLGISQTGYLATKSISPTPAA